MIVDIALLRRTLANLALAPPQSYPPLGGSSLRWEFGRWSWLPEKCTRSGPFHHSKGLDRNLVTTSKRQHCLPFVRAGWRIRCEVELGQIDPKDLFIQQQKVQWGNTRVQSRAAENKGPHHRGHRTNNALKGGSELIWLRGESWGRFFNGVLYIDHCAMHQNAISPLPFGQKSN